LIAGKVRELNFSEKLKESLCLHIKFCIYSSHESQKLALKENQLIGLSFPIPPVSRKSNRGYQTKQRNSNYINQ
jgi:hypothetical protein